MKVLIHEDRSEGLDFLLGMIVKRGYKAGLAKNGPEIMEMLSDENYNVILTNGGYLELNHDQHTRIKSSPVFIIDIAEKQGNSTDSKADLKLQKPFAISELWQAMDPDKAQQ